MRYIRIAVTDEEYRLRQLWKKMTKEEKREVICHLVGRAMYMAMQPRNDSK